jgi:hypothetical protein
MFVSRRISQFLFSFHPPPLLFKLSSLLSLSYLLFIVSIVLSVIPSSEFISLIYSLISFLRHHQRPSLYMFGLHVVQYLRTVLPVTLPHPTPSGSWLRQRLLWKPISQIEFSSRFISPPEHFPHLFLYSYYNLRFSYLNYRIHFLLHTLLFYSKSVFSL